jgi:dinuclear metal center YbgI/SA1388 family protein
MKLSELDGHLRELLRIDDFARMDSSLNGVQVGRADKEVEEIGVAVDAAQATIDRAVALGVDLLLVHHGFFWGHPLAVTGTHYSRIKALLDADIALYAVHLPLDAHAELGNNAQMAQALSLTDLSPFGVYKGVPIGWSGTLPEPTDIASVAAGLFGNPESVLGTLPMGAEKNRTVALVSGGAPESVREAIEKQIDLFVTGDASHVIYHDCMEAGINVIFGGHYNTETWGVRAVGAHLTREFGIKHSYIDVPTGL